MEIRTILIITLIITELVASAIIIYLVTPKKLRDEDKAYSCKYFDGDYCSKIKHPIENGFASKHHCKDCKYFKLKGLK